MMKLISILIYVFVILPLIIGCYVFGALIGWGVLIGLWQLVKRTYTRFVTKEVSNV